MAVYCWKHPIHKPPVAWLLIAFLLTSTDITDAQQPRIPRIGVVSGTDGSGSSSAGIKLLRQVLQDLGYTDGKNIVFEHRYTEGDRDRIPGILAELIRLKIDLLFSTQAIVIRAAKQATKTIPIVMAITPDPVATGIIQSLARPGGNITGLTFLTRELSGKRLELMTEMISGLSRVGILSMAGSTPVKDYEPAARTLKLSIQSFDVQGPNPDFSRAFQAAVKARIGAIITTSVPGLAGHHKQIANLALHHRLPLMSESVSVVLEDGGLATYDANRDEVFKRAAVFVDKILKGTKPADLPVEQPTKFDFVINLKTAQQIGVTIPPEILARASRIIR